MVLNNNNDILKNIFMSYNHANPACASQYVINTSQNDSLSPTETLKKCKYIMHKNGH